MKGLVFWLGLFLVCQRSFACPLPNGVLYLNTSNLDKLREYQEYLSGCRIQATQMDLEEPLADDRTVIQYKASWVEEGYLVDDASLNIEGAEIGPQIRFRLETLPDYVGRRAEFSCLLGIREKDQIKIFQGKVTGRIVERKGAGFGVGPFFLPDGASQTLGEFMDPQFNPRFLALQNFLKNSPIEIRPLLTKWEGKFQGHQKTPASKESSL